MRRELRRQVRRDETKNLVLRNGIYYYRTDIRRSNGGYFSFRKSLCTDIFSVAMERLTKIKVIPMDYKDLTPDDQKAFARWYNAEIDDKLSESELEALQSGNSDAPIKMFFDMWNGDNNEFTRTSNEKLIELWCRHRAKLDASETGFAESAAIRNAESKKSAIAIVSICNELLKRKENDPTIKIQFSETSDLYESGKKYLDWEHYQYAHADEQNQIPLAEFLPSMLSQMVAVGLNVNPSAIAPQHTISEVIKYAIGRMKGKLHTKERKKRDFEKMLESVGVNVSCDYSVINSKEKIREIIAEIKARADIKNDQKNMLLVVLREFIEHAHNMESEHYQDTTSEIVLLDKTPKSEKDSFWPFDDEQLSNIFDPKHDFFEKNPEHFLACIISLFSGARICAAVTLQRQDVSNIDGVDCLEFRTNHPKKHLKNEASERTLPIASQLIDWGFVDLIKQCHAAPTDFIFRRTEELKNPDKKFMAPFIRFIRKIGIKSENGRRFSFHSFRKTISNKLDDLHIQSTKINALIGWEGQDTREQYYSKRGSKDLKIEIDKLVYPEDVLHLDYWKPIIHNAYLNQEQIVKTRKRRTAK